MHVETRFDYSSWSETSLLLTAVGALGDVRPALIEMADAYKAREADVFATRDSGAWAPLNAATVRIKGNRRVLVESGALLASFTQSGAPGHYETYRSDSVSVGSRDENAVRAKFVKFGANVFGRDPSPPLSDAEASVYPQILLGHVLSAGGAGHKPLGLRDLGFAS